MKESEKISHTRVDSKNYKNPACCRKIIEISSRSNRSVKELKSLLTGRGIKRHGKTLVSGKKIVSELIRFNPDIILGWISSAGSVFLPSPVLLDIPCYKVTKELFRELDIHGTGYPLLVVKVPECVPYQENKISDNVILMIAFQDPLNVGAVIRSAAAFAVTSIVLLKEAASPFHPKSIRAAGTTVFAAKFMEGPSINEVRSIDRSIIALSPQGIDINSFSFPEHFVLLPGVEGPGLPPGLHPDFMVSIPMEPNVESLNASVATSIVLYEWYRVKR